MLVEGSEVPRWTMGHRVSIEFEFYMFRFKCKGED